MIHMGELAYRKWELQINQLSIVNQSAGMQEIAM